MKKIIALLSVLVCLFAFAACGKSEPSASMPDIAVAPDIEVDEGVGEQTEVDGFKFYVNSIGITSVPVAASGVTFLQDASESVTRWFGIDNGSGAIPSGAILRVRTLSQIEDADAYMDAYHLIDTAVKKQHQRNSIPLFRVWLENAEGEVLPSAGTLTLLMQQDAANPYKVYALSDGEDVLLNSNYISSGLARPAMPGYLSIVLTGADTTFALITTE